MATASDVPDLHETAAVACTHARRDKERESTATERRSGHSTRSCLHASFGKSDENGYGKNTAIESVRPESMWYT